jgi:hypothetical protein
MGHTDYRTLINRGRKAGLNTSELYSAMTSCSTAGTVQFQGHSDGNGFVSSYNQQGRRVYHPAGPYPRP